MKKTDIGVVLFMYAVCGFFYYHMTKLKASSQTYPRFTIILLFGARPTPASPSSCSSA